MCTRYSVCVWSFQYIQVNIELNVVFHILQMNCVDLTGAQGELCFVFTYQYYVYLDPILCKVKVV